MNVKNMKSIRPFYFGIQLNETESRIKYNECSEKQMLNYDSIGILLIVILDID